MLNEAAMFLSFMMSVFLFLIGYWEAIKISRQKGMVKGEMMIFCFVMGLVFAFFANSLSIKVA
jgi:hypothetical protein